MDETASNNPSISRDADARWSWLIWLVMSVVATAALSLVAAHAPARIRLLGLFFAAFGGVIAGIVTQLERVLDAGVSRRIQIASASLLTAIGLVGSTFETIRLERGLQASMPMKDRMQVEIQNSGLPGIENQSAGNVSQGGLQWSMPVQTTWTSYLARRTRPLGSWKTPLPELFWLSELVVAMICGGYVASILSSPPTSRDPMVSS